MNRSLFKFVFIFIFAPWLVQAHVTLEPQTASPGGYAKLVFRVPHDCEGSATTQIAVQLPQGCLSVKPQVHAGWKIKTTKFKLSTPVESHGKQITETVSEVTWQGGPLSDEYMDEFGLSLKLPDTPGAKLVFPVIQTCQKGVSRWTETPPPEHAHHAKFPAPYLMLETKTSAKPDTH